MTLPIRQPLRLAASALALLLAACGGGGSSGDETPPVAGKTLTLAGIVTDAPVANARVTVRVGSQSFTTNAGADGRYRFAITVPDSAGNSLVSFEGRGPTGGPSSRIALLSQGPSFNSLFAAAGADRELTATEAPAVNVTHLSTAAAVLVAEANGGSAPATEAALQIAEGLVDPDAALELAAAIKLIVDQPASYELPTGFADTLVFARNRGAREAFIGEVRASNPEDLDQARADTVADPNVAPAMAAGSVPANLLFVASVADQNTFNLTNAAQQFRFNGDGSGDYTSRVGRRAMNWSTDGNALRITPTAPIQFPPVDLAAEFDPARQQTVFCSASERYDYLRLVRLPGRAAVITPFGNERRDCRTDSGETFTTDQPLADEFFVTRIETSDLLPAPGLSTARDLALYTLRTEEESDYFARIAGEVLSFTPGGSGSSRFFAGNFSWQVLDAGKTLQLNFSSGATSRYQVLRTVDAVASVVLISLTSPGGATYLDANLMFVGADLDPLTPDLVPGAYYQFGKGEEITALDPLGKLDGFWLEFFGDGTGRQVSDAYVRDQDGEIVFDDQGEPQVTQVSSRFARFSWLSTEDSITNTRTFNTQTSQTQCPEGSTDCVVWDRREIVPVNFRESGNDDSRVYVVERRQFAAVVEEGLQEDTPTTYLLRFYDVEDLPAETKRGTSGAGDTGAAQRERR